MFLNHIPRNSKTLIHFTATLVLKSFLTEPEGEVDVA